MSTTATLYRESIQIRLALILYHRSNFYVGIRTALHTPSCQRKSTETIFLRRSSDNAYAQRHNRENSSIQSMIDPRGCWTLDRATAARAAACMRSDTPARAVKDFAVSLAFLRSLSPRRACYWGRGGSSPKTHGRSDGTGSVRLRRAARAHRSGAVSAR